MLVTNVSLRRRLSTSGRVRRCGFDDPLQLPQKREHLGIAAGGAGGESQDRVVDDETIAVKSLQNAHVFEGRACIGKGGGGGGRNGGR